jgi:YD repeat-containing protein
MKNLRTLSLITAAILGLNGCGTEHNTNGSESTYNNGVTNYVNTKIDYDTNNDNTINYSEILTYNSNCDMTSKYIEAHQGNSFYIPERMTTFTYDSTNHHLITTLIDIDNDNTIDDTGTHTYTNGKLTRLIWASGSEHNSTYNSQGNLKTFTIAFPGMNNVIEKDIHSYNNQNQLIRTDIHTDFNQDNIIDRIINYTYDSNGNLSITNLNRIDFVGDTIIDMRFTHTYNSDNKMLTQSIDIGADSTINSIITATYDSNGNMKTAELDDNNDGVINKVEHYTWEVCQ